jgi:hypothetical protein
MFRAERQGSPRVAAVRAKEEEGKLEEETQEETLRPAGLARGRVDK